MSLFSEWNDLLLRQFFSRSVADEQVFLAATADDLDRYGLRLDGREGLLRAVSEGPPWIPNQNDLTETINRLVRQRASKIRSDGYVDPGDYDDTYIGYEAPTYLPILAVWVLAASEPTGGFYNAVASLTGKRFDVAPQSREAMHSSWTDLQRWTSATNGQFGRFEVRVLGGYSYVGLAKSQSLVSVKDKRGLPKLFFATRLRPQQSIDIPEFEILKKEAIDAYYLSSSLRNAFEESDYADPLRQILGRELNDWDGRKPVESSSIEDKADESEESQLTITVALELADTVTTEWVLHWSFPRYSDASTYKLAYDDSYWRLESEEFGDAVNTVTPDNQALCRELLSKSADGQISFLGSQISLGDYGVPEPVDLVLQQTTKRILVWDPVNEQRLIESSLPLFGLCYVLHHRRETNYLTAELSGGNATWGLEDSTGLPNDWSIGSIQDCEKLTPSERQILTDDIEDIGARGRLRLVGGRRIQIGSGRVYAFYDLPFLDVEAEVGAEILSDGLILKDVKNHTEKKYRSRQGFKRYGIEISNPSISRFEIKLLVGNVQTAKVILRVSSSTSTGVSQVHKFGLARDGEKAMVSPSVLGLLSDAAGVPISRTDESQSLKHFQSFKSSGYSFGQLDGPALVAAEFLDSLGDRGTIAYGSARDQVFRMSKRKSSDVQPALLLLELRAMGHLELETDDSGHLVRVHSVPPLIYSCPLTQAGMPVFVIAGSLRLAHWEQCQKNLGKNTKFVGQTVNSFPALIAQGVEREEVMAFARANKFLFADKPALPLLKWVAGLRDMKDRWTVSGMDSPTFRLRSLCRFMPEGADYKSADDSVLTVDDQVGASLHRFEDPKVQGLRAYLLGAMDQSGRKKYSFLKDSKWGPWFVLDSFAKFLEEKCGWSDVHPWPVPYSLNEASIYLPARLRPPFLLERAMILCSGLLPEVSENIPFGGSTVYDSFKEKLWLSYSNIPRDFALEFASKLNGKLMYLDHQAAD